MAKLYVGGQEIGISVDDKDLEDAFTKFGHISKIWVARKPPGFAFIEFEDARDADDAVKDMDGTEVRGCRIRVEVSRRGDAGGSRGSGGDIEMKPGDWKCNKCGVVNFARRTECFRCHAPKEDDRYGRRSRSRSRSGRRYRSRSRSPRRERRRSPERRRSRSPERRRRRSPSPERRRRRSPSPDRRRRSPTPEKRRKSSSRSPRRDRDERERRSSSR